MADIVYLAVVAGFFAVAYLLVLACDRIIGPELAADAEPSEPSGPSGPKDEQSKIKGKQSPRQAA